MGRLLAIPGMVLYSENIYENLSKMIHAEMERRDIDDLGYVIERRQV